MSSKQNWYLPGLAMINERTQNCEKLLQVMAEKSGELNLEHMNRVLSIGPGYGRLDVPLLTLHCPRLTHYIGVEPNQHEAKILQDRLDRELANRNVKIDIAPDMVETWTGPEEPVDLILLSNVLYFIPDREALYQRCREWLAPGGVLVMVHLADQHNIYAYIAERFDCAHFCHTELILQDLNKLGWQNIKQESHYFELDIRDRDESIMNFLLKKDANRKEIADLDRFLCEILPTGIATMEMSMIWWTKE